MPSDPPSLLAFGAHPDDIEFGCGAVIAREAQAGRKSHFVIATRGESATNGSAEERTAEAEAAARALQATVEFVELGGDAHLAPAVPHVLALASIIRRVRPRCILAPTTVPDQHPDHVAVGRMVRDAARLARYGGVAELREQPPHAVEHVFFYAITVEGEPPGAPLLVDVSTVVGPWTTAMKSHQSQLRTRDYVELQLTRARLLGLRAGVEYAWPLWSAEPLLFGHLHAVPGTARRF